MFSKRQKAHICLVNYCEYIWADAGFCLKPLDKIWISITIYTAVLLSLQHLNYICRTFIQIYIGILIKLDFKTNI